MIVFSRGQFHRDDEPSVTLGNGGFLHGYGVFTTLRLYRGQAPDLKAHLNRLQIQGRQLGLDLPLDLDEVTDVISELVAVNKLQNKDFRLRISVARDTPKDFLSVVPGSLPEDLVHWQTRGIAAAVLGSDYQRTHLPRLKTLNYLPSLLALQEADARGCAEAIIVSGDGDILEGAVSNIFVVLGGVLATPRDDGRILPGLTRRRVLKLAEMLECEVRETALGLDDLRQADEVFLTNSVREVLPVVSWDEHQVGNGRVGDLTGRILQDYQRSFYPTD